MLDRVGIVRHKLPHHDLTPPRVVTELIILAHWVPQRGVGFVSLTFIMNTPPINAKMLLRLTYSCLILVDIAVWTELVGPALPLGGVGVASVHVEG